MSRGIEILNVQIGSEEFIMRKLNLKLKEIEKDVKYNNVVHIDAEELFLAH